MKNSRMMLLVTALTLLALTTTVLGQGSSSSTGTSTPFVPPTTLNVGIVSDTQTGSVWTFAIVFDDINNDTSILPNTKLTYTYTEAAVNSKADSAAMVVKMRTILAANPVAVIGCRYSDDSKMIAWETMPSKIPQISWGSSATDFSDKAAFPYFSRTYPDVGKEMYQLAAFLLYHNWLKVGVFYSTDSTGASMFTSFSQACKLRGIKIVGSSIVSDATATAADLEYPMSILAASKARILIDLCNYKSIHPQLILVQEKYGLRGPGYQWIGSHASMVPFTTTQFANGTENPAYAGKLDGHINMVSQQVDDRPLYKVLKQKIIDYPDTPAILSMQAKPYTRVNTWNWAQSQAQQYDAVKLLALALHELIEVQKVDPMSTAGRALLNTQIRKGKFVGVSGDIALDSVGDVLVPFQAVQTMPAGYTYVASGSFTLTNTTNIYTYTQSPNQKFYWVGGGAQPVDTVQREIYSNSKSVRDGMIITAAIIMGLLLATNVYLWVKRNSSIIKATSHTFTQLSVFGAMMITSSVIARMMIQNTSDVKTIDGDQPLLSDDGQLINEDISWQNDAKNVAAAEMYLINLGYYLLVGSLLVKTWRISRIFNMRKIKTVRGTDDVHLLLVLLGLLLCEVGVMIGLHYGDEFQFSLNRYNDTTDIHELTREHGKAAVSFPIIYVFRFLILVPTCLFTFKVRNIPSAFNEALQLLVTVYNLAFMSILLPIIESTMNVSTDPFLIAHGAAVFFIVLTTSASLVAPKIFGVATKATESSLHTAGNKSTPGNASSDNEGKRPVTDGSSNGPTGSNTTRTAQSPSNTKRAFPTHKSSAGPSQPMSSAGAGQTTNNSYIPKPSPKRQTGGSNVSQLGVEMSSNPSVQTASELSPQPSPPPHQQDAHARGVSNAAVVLDIDAAEQVQQQPPYSPQSDANLAPISPSQGEDEEEEQEQIVIHA